MVLPVLCLCNKRTVKFMILMIGSFLLVSAIFQFISLIMDIIYTAQGNYVTGIWSIFSSVIWIVLYTIGGMNGVLIYSTRNIDKRNYQLSLGVNFVCVVLLAIFWVIVNFVIGLIFNLAGFGFIGYASGMDQSNSHLTTYILGLISSVLFILSFCTCYLVIGSANLWYEQSIIQRAALQRVIDGHHEVLPAADEADVDHQIVVIEELGNDSIDDHPSSLINQEFEQQQQQSIPSEAEEGGEFRRQDLDHQISEQYALGDEQEEDENIDTPPPLPQVSDIKTKTRFQRLEEEEEEDGEEETDQSSSSDEQQEKQQQQEEEEEEKADEDDENMNKTALLGRVSSEKDQNSGLRQNDNTSSSTSTVPLRQEEIDDDNDDVDNQV